MLLRILATLTFAVCFSTPVLAGTVETNVRICGAASPYERLGEPALGMFGSTSTGLKEQFFRFKGFLSIESNVDQPKGDRADAIVDFATATQLRGVRLCVRGNLETIQKAGKVYYYVTPKFFQLSEKTRELLLPSLLAGVYSQPLPAAPTLELMAVEDLELGRKFFFNELPELLRSLLGAPCEAVDAWINDPSALKLSFVQKERTLLSADVSGSCGTAEDRVTVHVEFRRNTLGNIEGLIYVERNATAKIITLNLHR